MRNSHRFLALSLVSAGLLTSVTGCPSREVSKVDPAQAKEQEKRIPVELNRDLDILFVIDNSGSMQAEQASLVANFNNFINVLQTIDGGLPNVHIGVISTDVGAGPFSIPGCSGNGNNGALQDTARNTGCTPPSDHYISDVLAADGSTRITNYTGTLADTFSCIARLGTTGCGFEQPLESMRKALDPTNANNQGFLRDSAFLAVIIITDEDDCSAKDTQLFNTADTSISSTLGPLSSYRCFEFGVVCEPDDRSTLGPRQNCAPRADSQYLEEVNEYVAFLKSLKPDDPSLVITAGIIGNPSPVAVGLDPDDGNPELNPSCTSNTSGTPNCNVDTCAAPAIRLAAFLEQFPNRNTTTTICNEDLTDALIQIADLLAEVIGNPCLEGDLPLTNGVPDCAVTDIRFPDTDRESQSVVPHCPNNNPSGAATPCWHVVTNTVDCTPTAKYPTQLEMVVERGGASVPSGTFVDVRCVVN